VQDIDRIKNKQHLAAFLFFEKEEGKNGK